MVIRWLRKVHRLMWWLLLISMVETATTRDIPNRGVIVTTAMERHGIDAHTNQWCVAHVAAVLRIEHIVVSRRARNITNEWGRLLLMY